MTPRVLHQLREETDGIQIENPRTRIGSVPPRTGSASSEEAPRPFAFPPLPPPPAPVCANLECECADLPESCDDSASVSECNIPVPVYECIVKQWSKETPPDERPRSGAASDGSLERDKEDETITSEQVASLLAAVQNPRSPAPVGARERRRPLDKTKRRKGIYITTASDDGGEDEPPSAGGRGARLSDELRTPLPGDKSDDSYTNGPPSPSYASAPPWPRADDVRRRRARLSHQSSDERDDDSYRALRKFGVTSRGESPSEADSDRTASPSPLWAGGRRSLAEAGGACGAGGARGAGGGHVRATSSPSKLAGARAGAELLAELLRGSSEALSNASAFDNVVLTLHQHNDTRTHVVVELYETEKSYVDALDILVKKYLQPLKSPENAGLLDSFLVDEIFYQVPAILSLHQAFLEQLRRRLEQWDLQQKVADVFLDVFTKPTVMDTYMSFINNLRRARETIKAAAASRPAFARFLDAMARDHKGKLSLDNLLIKPVQKFPGYKLLIQRLIKHTDQSHPDHKLLLEAQKEIHELLELINCTEKESLELEQQQQTLRDLEQMIEGLSGLVTADRTFLRHEAVTMTSAQGTVKDRALFLFNDTLLITSVKRRTGTIKKPIPTYQSSIASQMEGNKYKLLMRISLADLDIVKAKDENVRRVLGEVEALAADVGTLARLLDGAASLRAPRPALDELLRELLAERRAALAERRAAHALLACLDLTLNTPNGPENLTVIFPTTEKRSSWEEVIIETKQKLCVSGAEVSPQFLSPVPIRKTRAGLQFTCAAPAAAPPGRPPDVWVCNSDGYVGQVCVVSLSPRPHVTSCNGVCNARILCVACVPAPAAAAASASASAPASASASAAPLARHHTLDIPNSSSLNSTGSVKPGISISDPNDSCKNIRLDSSSSSSSEDEGSSCSSAEASRPTRTRSSQLSQLSQLSQTSQASQASQWSQLSQTSQVSHHKSLSAPAPAPAAAPVAKSSSNPAVDRHAAGALSSPSSRQSSEEGAPQPTMWLGTEDGCIHVYNCLDNIRVKKNKLKMHHSSGVYSIVYLEEKVFVALGNGDLVVYCRDIEGVWSERCTLAVGGGAPVSAMLPGADRLWCAAHAAIKIVCPHALVVEETFQISSESKPISHMALHGGALWLALHNAAQLRCYRATSREPLADINITPHVTKMLHGCDDIIRQHKAACLRVTALAAHGGALWVGTSAGVLLTACLHRAPDARGAFTPPALTGIPYGHTGHVRFLTIVENPVPHKPAKSTQTTLKTKGISRRSTNAEKLQKQAESSQSGKETLVISGGDGYEDFRSTNAAEDAGREDSTNHLLLWRV